MLFRHCRVCGNLQTVPGRPEVAQSVGETVECNSFHVPESPPKDGETFDLPFDVRPLNSEDKAELEELFDDRIYKHKHSPSSQ